MKKELICVLFGAGIIFFIEQDLLQVAVDVAYGPQGTLHVPTN